MQPTIRTPKNIFLDDFQKHALMTIGFGILSAIIAIWWFYNAGNSVLNNNLSDAASKAQNYLDETLAYNERVMTALGKQIAEHGDENDLRFIAKLITNASASSKNGESTTTLSWSGFDWVDKRGIQVVNSEIGIRSTPLDVSDREYAVKAPKEPWKLQLSAPSIGRQSGVPVLPAGVGVTDKNGRYMGAIAVGIDITKLMNSIYEYIRGTNAHYIIIGRNNRIVFASDTAARGVFPLSKVSSEAGTFDQAISAGNISYTHYRKLEHFPYTIVTGFDHKAFLLSNVISAGYIVLGCTVLCGLVLVLLHAADKRSTRLLAAIEEHTLHLSELTTDASSQKKKKDIIQNISSSLENLHKKKEITRQYDKARIEFCRELRASFDRPLEVIITQIHNAMNALDVTFFNKDTHKGFLETILRNCMNLKNFAYKDVEIKNVNVSQIIHQCTDFFSKEAYDKNITIKAEIQNLPQVECDFFRVKHILFSLVAHALVFIPSNQGKILTIRAEQDAEDVRISIEDNGLGISKEERESAYESDSFTQTAFSKEITWMRLKVIQYLVELHGGEFDVKAEYGKGTSFSLTLPIKQITPYHAMMM